MWTVVVIIEIVVKTKDFLKKGQPFVIDFDIVVALHSTATTTLASARPARPEQLLFNWRKEKLIKRSNCPKLEQSRNLFHVPSYLRNIIKLLGEKLQKKINFKYPRDVGDGPRCLFLVLEIAFEQGIHQLMDDIVLMSAWIWCCRPRHGPRTHLRVANRRFT